MNPAQGLHSVGQSVWYDNISRELIESGELARLIAEWGVRGLTSNPSIFDAALKQGTSYDSQISSLRDKSLSVEELFDELAIHDIAAAADLLLPVYNQSNGEDGFCSIEVSPTLARDAQATIAQAKRLYARLERPNIMIKIPGTQEGLPAVRACLEEGISINITLLFSVENYRQVAMTYCDAMRVRLSRGQPVAHIRSVASFFVSRVDALVDSQLQKLADADMSNKEEILSLQGKLGIANSKLAYQAYREIFEGAAFADLASAGVAVQRPLWASTSTKNPQFRDVIYVEELIGPNTVNTVPHATLAAFVDHGVVKKDSVLHGVAEARALVAALESVGVNVAEVCSALQEDGVKKFIASFEALSTSLQNKIAA
jgi:transaldolase